MQIAADDNKSRRLFKNDYKIKKKRDNFQEE